MTKNVEKMLSSMRKETKELKPLDLNKRLAEMEKEMKVANKKLTKLKKTDDTIIRFSTTKSLKPKNA